ncbi:hypothetical protein BH23PAT2_BH23PAT2_02260 [soil metagenome]
MDFESELVRKEVAEAMEMPMREAVTRNDTLRAEGKVPFIGCSARSIEVILRELDIFKQGEAGDEIIAPYILTDRRTTDGPITGYVVRGVARWREAQPNQAPQDGTIEQTT